MAEIFFPFSLSFHFKSYSYIINKNDILFDTFSLKPKKVYKRIATFGFNGIKAGVFYLKTKTIYFVFRKSLYITFSWIVICCFDTAIGCFSILYHI